MLTSVVTVSTTSTISSAVTTISMITDTGLSQYGVLAVIALIVLLSAKEILEASDLWSRAVNSTLNMCIIPLLLSFFAIVAYRILDIL